VTVERISGDDRRRRERSLWFFAKMVAGQGHEITNVFNIINELSGLQQDLLAAAARGRSLDAERMGAIAGKIMLQVQRGENMVRQLRYFARNTGVPVTVFDLQPVLEQIVFLAERHVRLHKSSLVAEFSAEKAALECSPFELQHAVFVSVDAALLTAPVPERIVVGCRVEGGRALLKISSEVEYEDEPAIGERVAVLGELLAELGGEVVAAPRASAPFALAFALRTSTACDALGGVAESQGEGYQSR
jgi:hypothetical protein